MGRDPRRILGLTGGLAAGAVLIVALILAAPRPASPPSAGSTPAPTAPAAAVSTVVASAGPSPQAPITAPPTVTAPTPTSQPTPFAYMNPDGAPGGASIASSAAVEVARGLTTFAGVWIDRNQRDLHVSITGGLDDAIAALSPYVPADGTLYFHFASRTYAELEAVLNRVIADREALDELGIYFGYGSVNEKENVVEIGIDPFNDDTVDIIHERYGPDVLVSHAPKPPPYLNTPWPTIPEELVAVRSEDRETLLTCGGRAFPESALDLPGGAESEQGPIYDALRQNFETFGPEFPRASRLSWILAVQSDTDALFLARDGEIWMTADAGFEDGEWYGGGMGQCRPIVTVGEDVGSAEWALDPDYPAPTADSTRLNILVLERQCSSGRPASGRMLAPIVEYADGTLTMIVGVTRVVGPANCIGNRPTAAVVTLPEPLGDRTLLDGGKYPPAPPVISH